MRERRIDAAVAFEHRAQDSRDQPDYPAPDNPQDDGGQYFGSEVDASGHQEYAYGFKVHDVLARSMMLCFVGSTAARAAHARCCVMLRSATVVRRLCYC